MSRRWGCRRLGRGDGGLYLEVRHQEPNQLPMTMASLAGAARLVDRHPGSFVTVLVAGPLEYFRTLAASGWRDAVEHESKAGRARY